MAELKPCPVCGKVPNILVRMMDIPEAEELFPTVALRCDCKEVLRVVSSTKEKALEFAEEVWNKGELQKYG
jgi:hypothetical protein